VAASERQHLEVEGAGHYGIFSGRRWRDIVYPQVVKFIQAHAPKAKVAAPKAVAAVQAAAAPVVANAAVKAPVKPTKTSVAKPVAKVAAKAVAAPSAKAVAKAAAPVKAVAKTPAKAVAKVAAKSSKAAVQPQDNVKTTWVAPKA
jgi:poly(3-hydroxybutyrate) depolymerase